MEDERVEREIEIFMNLSEENTELVEHQCLDGRNLILRIQQIQQNIR